MNTIELQPDVNYNPPPARTFPPNRLQPVAPIDDAAIREKLGWSRNLDHHLSEWRMARAEKCRAVFVEYDLTTPWNTYKSLLGPWHCNDWISCPHCATKSSIESRLRTQQNAETVRAAGAGVAQFSFVFTLPGWQAQIEVPGCQLAESRGLVCPTTQPCRACANRRIASDSARAEENAVFDAIQAAAPKHGGWWFRTLEPIEGINGRIAIRFTLFVVDRVFSRHAAEPSDLAAVFAAAQEAYQAALEELGGTDHGSAMAAQPALEPALEMLLWPLSLRLQAAVAAGQAPMPGALARWIRATGITQTTTNGKSRRVNQNGTWGALCGSAQRANLALLGIARNKDDSVPCQRTYIDTWRVIEHTGTMVRLQSESTGEFRAELASIATREGVNSRGIPTMKKPITWARIASPVSAQICSDAVRHISPLSDPDSAEKISVVDAVAFCAALAWEKGVQVSSPEAGQSRVLDLVMGPWVQDGGYTEFRPQRDGKTKRFWAPSPTVSPEGHDTNIATAQGYARRMTRADALIEVNRLNSEGWQAYYGINPRFHTENGKLPNIMHCGVLAMDFDLKKDQDPKAGAAKLAEHGLIPGLIVWSGNGAHVYLLLDAPITTERGTALAKRLATFVASDTIHDATRVLRLPYTINHKPGAHAAYTVYDGGNRVSADAVEAVLNSACVELYTAPAPVERRQRPVIRIEDPTMENYINALYIDQRAMLEDGAPHPEDTSGAAQRIIARLLDLGADEEMTFKILEETEAYQWKHWKREDMGKFVSSLRKWHSARGRGTA